MSTAYSPAWSNQAPAALNKHSHRPLHHHAPTPPKVVSNVLRDTDEGDSSLLGDEMETGSDGAGGDSGYGASEDAPATSGSVPQSRTMSASSNASDLMGPILTDLPTFATVPASASPTGTRSFDPFAPISSLPPSSFGPMETSLPASAALSPHTSPNLNAIQQVDQKADQKHRPASLYIPMDDPSTRPSGQNQWPFAAGRRPSYGSPSPVYPSSPSHINPMYADPAKSQPPPTQQLHAGPSTLSHHEHSSMGSTSSFALSESGREVSSRVASRPHSPRIDQFQTPPTQARYGTSSSSRQGSPRHSPQYSVGTNQLLSSRRPLKVSLARTFDSSTSWLLLYFSFNLGLTLFNKLVLQGFPFPWTLTGIQMLSGTVGTQVALHQGFFTQAKLTTREGLVMIAFSVLYTVNIAVSNLSLHLVTVPFHQVVRAMTPLFTIVLSTLFLNKQHARATYLSLMPVVIGVVFATYGDYYFTAWGFILTLIGTALAAIKTIVTNRVQVGRLKLHPLDLLIRMSPLAFVQCVLCGWWSGELDRVRAYGATQMTQRKAFALLVNGTIAFGLNVVSFTANKKTSALTMTVAANVKQVLTIILAVIIFNLALNPTNVFGITLTLAGGAWYARVELQEKSKTATLKANGLSNARLSNGVNTLSTSHGDGKRPLPS